MKPLSEQLLEDQQSEGVCPCFFVNDCSANDAPAAPSLTEGGPSRTRGGRRRWAASTSARLKISLAILGFVAVFAGCGQDAPPPQPAEVKPEKPAVPEDVQSAAQALLGQETTVLLFGDLA